MERREFLRNTVAFCGALSLFSIEGCTPSRSVTGEFENGKLKIKKIDFAQDKWIVVNSNKTNGPVLLSKNDQGEYSAVLMICTHKQCEVKPAGTLLSCPCHGAEFSFTGKVLKEPADKDLQSYPTSANGEYVYIQILK